VLSRHAFIDFDSHSLLGFVVEATDYLPECTFVQFLYYLIPIGNVVAHNNLIEAALSVKSAIHILSMTANAVTP
jgi:hypothetical protein